MLVPTHSGDYDADRKPEFRGTIRTGAAQMAVSLLVLVMRLVIVGMVVALDLAAAARRSLRRKV